MNLNRIEMTIGTLRNHYQRGDFTPKQLISHILRRCRNKKESTIWIHLLTEAELDPILRKLEQLDPERTPLYGIPFAIKDNIDLAGVPTTSACPAFSYTPEESAFAVRQLMCAGAIPIGKTNMDQFATGLVGVRSPEPWGPCRNALNGDAIAGGSSSGSAVAVAKGWVSFALGTDTAGSGRVPAALNNIVGLKPSRGLLSTKGVVPACRSLDCVSIFALTAADASEVFDCVCAFDDQDAFARKNLHSNGHRYFNPESPPSTVGVPDPEQLKFFGSREAPDLFDQSLALLKGAGCELVTIDFEPFRDAATLLYEGPWVTERYLAIQELLDTSPDEILPVIREIVEPGKRASAADTFLAHYRLQSLAQRARVELDKVDVIATPTVGTYYTVNSVLADPIQLNSNLGYYTNFMNLMDCAAVAVPTALFANGVGFGLTLFHRAFTDKRLLSLAARLQKSTHLTLGATGSRLPVCEPKATPKDKIAVVVCGAHLAGLPLDWQLTERSGRLLEATTSSADYRLLFLNDGPPRLPGMMRVAENGAAIPVEVWELPAENFGTFVAEIPHPLGIGKVQLADGRWECGFVYDCSALAGATDITHHGGWKAYLQTLSAEAR